MFIPNYTPIIIRPIYIHAWLLEKYYDIDFKLLMSAVHVLDLLQPGLWRYTEDIWRQRK